MINFFAELKRRKIFRVDAGFVDVWRVRGPISAARSPPAISPASEGTIDYSGNLGYGENKKAPT
jgi:hypothetical protein